MFTAAYAAGTILGDADSWCAAAFHALAFGFLGMDGRRGGVRISLCGGFLNPAECNVAGRRRCPLPALAEWARLRCSRCTSYNRPSFHYVVRNSAAKALPHYRTQAFFWTLDTPD